MEVASSTHNGLSASDQEGGCRQGDSFSTVNIHGKSQKLRNRKSSNVNELPHSSKVNLQQICIVMEYMEADVD